MGVDEENLKVIDVALELDVILENCPITIVDLSID